jgi:hypothetical protein
MKAITDLTVEELALVQAAREKAEQEKAAKQAQFEKDITDKRAYAAKEMLKGEEQVKATYDYFKDFKSGEFEVVEYPLYREITIKDWNTREILFKEDYVVNSAYVKHIESGRKIRVDEHIVYSKWDRSKNKGYKMFIGYEARAYSKASTVETKLLNEINSIRVQQNAEQIKDAFITELISNPPFPNSIVENDYMINYKQIRIKFENGVIAKCIVHVEDGKAYLSIYSTEFPKPKIEGDTVMDKLKFISKLEF